MGTAKKKAFRDAALRELAALERMKKHATPMEWSRIHDVEKRLANAAHLAQPRRNNVKRSKRRRRRRRKASKPE